MPRKRMIDPNFWSDDKIIKISVHARLMFIALWNFTDDLGVHRDDNYSIKAEVFPIDSISIEDIEKFKQELIETELIIPYCDKNDGNLLFIKNWYKYQYIKKPTLSKYVLPDEILQFFNKDELEKYYKRTQSNEYRTIVEPVPPNRKEKNRNNKIEIKQKENSEKSTNYNEELNNTNLGGFLKEAMKNKGISK